MSLLVDISVTLQMQFHSGCLIYQPILPVFKMDYFNCCWGQHGGDKVAREELCVSVWSWGCQRNFLCSSVICTDSQHPSHPREVTAGFVVFLLLWSWPANTAADVLQVMEKPGMWDLTYFPQMNHLILKVITDISKFGVFQSSQGMWDFFRSLSCRVMFSSQYSS